MRDMFDYFEEGWYGNLMEGNNYRYYIIKKIRNKRHKTKILFLQDIDYRNDLLIWDSKKKNALQISPSLQQYGQIRNLVRRKNIRCEFYCYHGLELEKPVRKETWWNRIKVWFSRKVQYFAGYISIERAMKI